MITGSGTLTLNGANSQGFGTFVLFNEQVDTQAKATNDRLNFYFNGLQGPRLSVLHHYNYCLKNNIFNDSDISSTPSSLYYGISKGINNSTPNTYFRFNPSSSRLPQYEDNNEPFLIERGDEIRITYITPIGIFTGSNTITQDFTVLDVGFTDYASGSADNVFRVYNNLNSQFTGSVAGATGDFAVRHYIIKLM
jgi:hypothetical protein